MTARLHTLLTDVGLLVGAAHDFCADPSAGAVVVFTGLVRNASEGRDVRGLGYEAYPERAEPQLAALAEEVASRWPALAVWMEHRVGLLAIGEPAVVVGVSTGHRAEAFDACRHGIDALKASVAIWKQELWADGGTRWPGTD